MSQPIPRPSDTVETVPLHTSDALRERWPNFEIRAWVTRPTRRGPPSSRWETIKCLQSPLQWKMRTLWTARFNKIPTGTDAPLTTVWMLMGYLRVKGRIPQTIVATSPHTFEVCGGGKMEGYPVWANVQDAEYSGMRSAWKLYLMPPDVWATFRKTHHDRIWCLMCEMP